MKIKLIPYTNHFLDQNRKYFTKLKEKYPIVCIDVDGKWYTCCKKGEPEYEIKNDLLNNYQI